MIFSPIAHIGRKLSENVPSVPGFLRGNNAYLSPASPTYDAAGNLIQNGTTSYTYDAENRLIATASTSYVYDGYGNRIEKCTEGANAQGVGLPGTCATNASGTFYWLHKDGGTLTESDLGGNFTEVYDRLYGQIAARIDLPAKVVHYYFHDHLNSTSIVTDALGNIENESDYYPYGGEIVISSGDSNRYKFTGKERDSESSLDMFGARYYGSSLGRFMTPDWAAKPTAVPYAHFGNPQSLNLYSYVQNNPTTIGDPDGHCCDWQYIEGAVQAYASDTFAAGAFHGNSDNSSFQAGQIAGDKAALAERVGLHSARFQNSQQQWKNRSIPL